MGYTSVHWTLGPEVQAPDLARYKCGGFKTNWQLLEFHWLFENMLLVNMV